MKLTATYNLAEASPTLLAQRLGEIIEHRAPRCEVDEHIAAAIRHLVVHAAFPADWVVVSDSMEGLVLVNEAAGISAHLHATLPAGDRVSIRCHHDGLLVEVLVSGDPLPLSARVFAPLRQLADLISTRQLVSA